MKEKKVYTREDKIKYFNWLIFDLEKKLETARERLDYVMSENYQEWNGSLEKQLKNKKA